MSAPGLFKTPWVKCTSKALPRGIKHQVLSSLYSLLLSSFAISSFPIQSSSANPETILICRGKSRTCMHSSQCTVLSSTKPGHTKGRSEPFHASSRPGPRDRPFSASLKSAIPRMPSSLGWPSTNQFTALPSPGFNQYQNACGQDTWKINHIDLKQHKFAEASWTHPLCCRYSSTGGWHGWCPALL